MALLEEGRVCIKRFGRDAGSKAVITKVIDQNFVKIMSSTRPRDRKCNIKHLEFISEKVDLKNKAEVAHALEIDEAKVGSAPKAAAPKQAAQRSTQPPKPKK